MPNTLAIWHAAAQDLPWAAARAHLLDAAERAQLLALQDADDDRAWFLLSRVLRRVALEATTGTAAQDWHFTTTPLGAPMASRRHPAEADCISVAPTVSLAHTHGHVVVAAGHSAQVGIDVERLQRLDGGASRVTRLMARILTAVEHQQVRTLPEQQWGEAVLQRWALKEAVAKAVGQGLRGPWREVAPDVSSARLAVGEHRQANAPVELPRAWLPLARAPIWCGLLRPSSTDATVIAWAAAAEAPPVVRVHTTSSL